MRHCWRSLSQPGNTSTVNHCELWHCRERLRWEICTSSTPPGCLTDHVGGAHTLSKYLAGTAGSRVSNTTPLLKRFLDEDACEHFIEYTLIAILVALAAFIAFHGLGDVINRDLDKVGDSL